MEEHLEDGYFTFDGLEKGVKAQVMGELNPLVLLCVTSGSATSSDALVDVFHCKAKVTQEAIGNCRWTSCQGCACG